MTGSRLGASAARVLASATPAEKIAAARACARLIAASEADAGDVSDWPAAPDRPARPDRPLLAPPAAVPRRRLGSPEGRAALLHALAHIEFNAIDLAFDMAVRFAPAVAALGLPADAFVRDWVAVGDEEANHFSLLHERLQAYSGAYGDLAAHDGLWTAAAATADCVLARLSVCHLILEARGLDVTPGLAAGLRRHGDAASAAVIDVILIDEIGHVGVAARWFGRLAARRSESPASLFRTIAAARFRGRLKPPFNRAARDEAGLPAAFYDTDAGADRR